MLSYFFGKYLLKKENTKCLLLHKGCCVRDFLECHWQAQYSHFMSCVTFSVSASIRIHIYKMEVHCNKFRRNDRTLSNLWPFNGWLCAKKNQKKTNNTRLAQKKKEKKSASVICLYSGIITMVIQLTVFQTFSVLSFALIHTKCVQQICQKMDFIFVSAWCWVKVTQE